MASITNITNITNILNKCDLIEFGDACAPILLTQCIMKQKNKTLFLLGGFGFNNLIYFLNENKFEEIYKEEYLTLNDGTPVINFGNTLKRYGFYNKIRNSKYGFSFVHDFSYDRITQCIINYDFIKNEYNNKIIKLKESFQNSKILIFVHFCRNITNISDYKELEMIEALKKHMPNPSKKFYIFVYSNQDKLNESNQIIQIIYTKLKNSIEEFWLLSGKLRDELENEISTNFFETMKKLDIIM